jgi:hypothetical protein
MRALSDGSTKSPRSLDFAGGIYSPSCMEWHVTFRLQKSELAAATYSLLLHNPWTWVAHGIFTTMVVYLMLAMPAKPIGWALLAVAAVIFLVGMYLVSPLWQARVMAKEKSCGERSIGGLPRQPCRSSQKLDQERFPMDFSILPS